MSGRFTFYVVAMKLVAIKMLEMSTYSAAAETWSLEDSIFRFSLLIFDISATWMVDVIRKADKCGGCYNLFGAFVKRPLWLIFTLLFGLTSDSSSYSIFFCKNVFCWNLLVYSNVVIIVVVFVTIIILV